MGCPPFSKVVKVYGTFEIQTSDGYIECKKVMNNMISITEATQVFPQTIPGLSTKVQLSFGGVSLAKRIFLRVNYPVTVQFDQSSDEGYSVGVGECVFMSDNGITSIYITTGPNPTNVEAVIAG